MSIKLVLIGDAQVGKTGLAYRYVQSKKPDLTVYQATIGVDFLQKNTTVNLEGQDKDIRLQIWDIAGHERYRASPDTFYKNASAIILMVSLQPGETKQAFLRRAEVNIATHCKEIKSALPTVPPIYLMLGKTDLITENLLGIETALAGIAKQYNLRLAETGAVFTISALTSSDAEIAAPFLAAAKAGLIFSQTNAPLLAAAQKRQSISEDPRLEKKASLVYRFFAGIIRYLNKITGAVVGGILGTIATVLWFNPITVFFIIIRAAASFYKDDSILLATAFFIFSPLMALGSIYLVPFIGLVLSVSGGWQGGLISGIEMPWSIFNGLTAPSEDEKTGTLVPAVIRKADLVFGFLIMALVATVVAVVLFPATFGLAAITPVAIASLGLTGLSALAIAEIVGGITFIAASTLYGIGSRIYDVYADNNAYQLLDEQATGHTVKPTATPSYVQMATVMPKRQNTKESDVVDPRQTSHSPITPPKQTAKEKSPPLGSVIIAGQPTELRLT